MLAKVVPKARLASLAKDSPFSFIAPLCAADPMYHTKAVPVRLGAEVLRAMDSCLAEAHTLPHALSLLLVQSKNDTMTDPDGSRRLLASLTTDDKSANWLDYSWHFLSKEPGYLQTIGSVIRWMLDRT